MTTEQSDAVDAIRAQQVDAFPGRCTFTWTPTTDSDFCFPEVRCTNRSAAIHRHAWNAVEEDQWKARTITGLKPGTDYTVRNVSVDGAEPVTITTPSADHLPNAINRLQAYIDARTGPGHAARALRDENTHTILLDDLGAVLQAASRAIVLERIEEPRLSVDALAQIMCGIEGRMTGRPFDEVIAPGIELWMRHRHEAEALLAELRDAGYVA